MRVELGPRDVKQSQFVLVRRDSGERLTLQAKDAVNQIKEMLETVHNGLYAKYVVSDYSNIVCITCIIMSPSRLQLCRF